MGKTRHTRPKPARPPKPAPPPPGPAPTGVLADLVVCRLLTPGSKPGLAKLADDVGPLVRPKATRSAVEAVVAALRSAALMPPRGFRLTDAGRARGLAYLGVAKLPPRTGWDAVQGKYLLPRAAGLGPRLTAPKLAEYLLKRKYGLPVGLTGKAVRDAVVFKLLGFPDCRTMAQLTAAVLSREIGVEPPMTAADFAKAGLPVLAGAPRGGKAGYVAAALAGAFADPPGAFDLAGFAVRVLAAARDCPTGRFGPDKVFIGHVYRHLAADGADPGLTLDQFKRHLVEANRGRLLVLSRADMPELHPPADLDESLVTDLNARYHFLTLGAA